MRHMSTLTNYSILTQLINLLKEFPLFALVLIAISFYICGKVIPLL